MGSVTRRQAMAAALAAFGATALASCSTPRPGSSSTPSAATPSTPPPSPPWTPVTHPPATPGPPGRPDPSDSPVHPTGAVDTITTGLAAPWSVVPLADGTALISERDSGRILELTVATGRTRIVGTVPGVVHQGEGGLLGLTTRTTRSPAALYAYLTTSGDNRVVRMPLAGSPGNRRLGAPTNILTGIPTGTFHNGGRLAFGPDGMLYVTTGDATDGDNAQNRGSLGGKILRLTPDGGVPGSNPFRGSPVWSYGHRNPQGIAWDSRGTMWASEFGQNTWDELNVITPGANYGWPIVEGIAHDRRFVDPIHQWHTDEASPSGIAIVSDTIFMAALRGERLWVIDPARDGSPLRATSAFEGRFGRLRAAVAHGDELWLLTNNTDGRGTARQGDDHLLRVSLAA